MSTPGVARYRQHELMGATEGACVSMSTANEGAGPEDSDADPNADPTTASVRAQAAALRGIQDRPVAEHAERYQQIHAGLQAALADIDGN